MINFCKYIAIKQATAVILVLLWLPVYTQEENLEISNLEINCDLHDFSPHFIDSVSLVFSSKRLNIKSEKIVENAHSVYLAEKKGAGFGDAKRMNYLLNSDNHDACAGMSDDLKTIYIYKRFNGGDIYFSQKNGKNGKWMGPRKLIINTEFHESSACSFGDSLYFTSDKVGGKGKHDIYFSVRDSEGKWSVASPVDLLNTSSDENYVSLSSDGKSLYFSSDRDGDETMYDIFVSKLTDNSTWSEPEKMGSPFNSNYNDIGIIEGPDEAFYFASDRSDTGMVNYNIYMVKNRPEENVIVKVPIVLTRLHKAEKEKTGEVVQIKDSVTLKGKKDLIPKEIPYDKQEMADSMMMVFVKDLTIDRALIVMDRKDEPVAELKLFQSEVDSVLPVEKVWTKEKMTLDELKGVIDFDIKFCKVQVGTFRTIFSVDLFEKRFPKMKGMVEMTDMQDYTKFFMKETCLDLDCAASLQKKCLQEYGSVNDTFIGVYSTDGQRILIYFDVDSNKYMIVNSN